MLINISTLWHAIKEQMNCMALSNCLDILYLYISSLSDSYVHKCLHLIASI